MEPSCRKRWSVGLLLAGAWWPSCGGDDDDDSALAAQSCTEEPTCGGDPRGVWQSEQLCQSEATSIPLADLPPECAEAFELEQVIPSTTLTILDATLSEVGSFTIDWQMRFDVACISALAEQDVAASDVPAFCDLLATEFNAAEDTPFSAITCQVVDDVCTCDATQTESLDASIASAVDYTVEGNVLVTGGGQRSFCEQGDVLALQFPEPFFGVSGIRYRRAP